MFSEYASRFLAQSQSRISFRQPEEPARNPLERPRRREQGSRLPAGRAYGQRPSPSNPYQLAASHLSQFPFASRPPTAPVPLFHSTDDFREEDDEKEHEREVEDFYALQRSRRQFVQSRLDESSEAEDGGSRGSGLEDSGDGRESDDRGRGGGMKSSWQGGPHGRGWVKNKRGEASKPAELERALSEESSDGKGHMYDVGLGSTMRSQAQDDDPGALAVEMFEDDNPPSMQHFRRTPKIQTHYSPLAPQDTSAETQREQPPSADSDSSSLPPTVGLTAPEPPRQDVFWGNLYLICLIAMFASFALVYLHTYSPSSKRPLGDTVYTALHASFYLLATDTFVAIIVSLLWLALLRSYVRPLVYAIFVAVPVILLAFSLYPLISSFQGSWHGSSIQDQAMRWLSILPAAAGIFWVYAVYQGRHSLEKSIGILEFACKILAANPALLMLGFASLLGVVVWTWIWMGMFTRVFLGGHLAKRFFIIDASTWWLAVFFIMMYLWTLGIGAGIQRATTAATVSQWYFHRLVVPAPSSQEVVKAALSHATTSMFGTICLSTQLALLIRLPLLILPRRLIALVGICSYTLLPQSVTILTHPVTLTYAAIHSEPLLLSARAVAQLSFMNSSSPATSPRFRSRQTSSKTSNILPYNIALLLLHSTRLITSLALGFGAWVSTARSLQLEKAATASTIRGSLYAYVVALIAGAIGWAILGAMEGLLTGVVDAVVVCWASEVRNGEVKYCREAGWLLGDEEDGREGLLRV